MSEDWSGSNMGSKYHADLVGSVTNQTARFNPSVRSSGFIVFMLGTLDFFNIERLSYL